MAPATSRARRVPSARMSRTETPLSTICRRFSRTGARTFSIPSNIHFLHSMHPMPAVRQPDVHLRDRRLVGKDLVVGEDVADLGVPAVGAPLAGRVGDHRLHLGPYLFRRVGEEDRVAVALAHLPVVGPHQLRRFGQVRLGDRQALLVQEIKAPGDLAGELEVRDLVDADGDERRVVHQDVGRLEDRIAEEAVRLEVAGGLLPELLLVGRVALEPRQRRDHGEDAGAARRARGRGSG